MVSFALGVVGVIIICIVGKRTIGMAVKAINKLFDEIEKHMF